MSSDFIPTPPAPEPAGPLRSQRRAQAAADSLRTLIRDHALRQFGAVDAAATAVVDMNLRFTVRPGEGWALTFDPPLDEQVQAQLEDRLARVGVFVRGRVYCFRCGGAAVDRLLLPEDHRRRQQVVHRGGTGQHDAARGRRCRRIGNNR